MNSKNTALTLALAGALTTALAAVGSPAFAQASSKEKCYGVSLKGQNDCASKGVNSCAGQSKADYEGTAWKYVTKGTCETIKTPNGMGSLHPIKS